MLVTILVFLLILSVLVLVHELGHFLMAKKLGIKVEEFGFGLPPRAWGFKKGETTYSINWLPIGGFVKLYGEDDAGAGKISLSKKKEAKDTVEGGVLSMREEEDITLRTGNEIIEEKINVFEEISIKKINKASKKQGLLGRAFFARPAWQRVLVVTAGVLMNFLLAVVIISYLFTAVGVSVPGNKVLISAVLDTSPAKQAGLKVGDTVESINGIKITSGQQLVSITKQNLGKKIKLEVSSEKSPARVIEVTPRVKYPSTEGPMGVAISPNIEVKKYPWYLAPILGTQEALKMSWLIFMGLLDMFYQLIVSGAVPKGVAGPVGIAELTGQFVAIGPYAVLSFVSLLSLNLAILNILPFPALDGGRLLFIIIGVIGGRKISLKYEGYAHAIGMIILIGLIILITVNDLIRLFTGQPVIPNQ